MTVMKVTLYYDEIDINDEDEWGETSYYSFYFKLKFCYPYAYAMPMSKDG